MQRNGIRNNMALKAYQALAKAKAKADAKKREDIGNEISHKGAVRASINDANKGVYTKSDVKKS